MSATISFFLPMKWYNQPLLHLMSHFSCHNELQPWKHKLKQALPSLGCFHQAFCGVTRPVTDTVTFRALQVSASSSQVSLGQEGQKFSSKIITIIRDVSGFASSVGQRSLSLGQEGLQSTISASCFLIKKGLSCWSNALSFYKDPTRWRKQLNYYLISENHLRSHWSDYFGGQRSILRSTSSTWPIERS